MNDELRRMLAYFKTPSNHLIEKNMKIFIYVYWFLGLHSNLGPEECRNSSANHYTVALNALYAQFLDSNLGLPSWAAVYMVPGNFGCGSAVLAAITTLAPSLATFKAIAFPIPRLAPVMKTV